MTPSVDVARRRSRRRRRLSGHRVVHGGAALPRAGARSTTSVREAIAELRVDSRRCTTRRRCAGDRGRRARAARACRTSPSSTRPSTHDPGRGGDLRAPAPLARRGASAATASTASRSRGRVERAARAARPRRGELCARRVPPRRRLLGRPPCATAAPSTRRWASRRSKACRWHALGLGRPGRAPLPAARSAGSTSTSSTARSTPSRGCRRSAGVDRQRARGAAAAAAMRDAELALDVFAHRVAGAVAAMAVAAGGLDALVFTGRHRRALTGRPRADLRPPRVARRAARPCRERARPRRRPDPRGRLRARAGRPSP